MSSIEELFAVAIQDHQAARLEEAAAGYRQVLALNNRHEGALHMLAILAASANQTEAAADLLSKVVEVNPRNAEAYSDLASILRAQGRLDEAIAACRQAVALKPDFAAAYSNLSVCFMERGLFEDALSSAQQALQFDPDNAAACQNLGAVLHRLGRVEEAVAAFHKVIRLDPASGAAYGGLGAAFIDLERFEEAAAACRESLRLRPGDADAYSNLGNALRASGDLENAAAACREAIRLSSVHIEAHNNLGAVLLEKSRLHEARRAFETAVRLDPDSAEAYNNLGAAMRALGRYEEANGCLQRALQLKPGFADAVNNLGLVMKDQFMHHEAMAVFREAIRLKPSFAAAHTNLGNTLSDAGEMDEAIEEHLCAVELDGKSGKTHASLAQTLVAMGRFSEAYAAFDRAMELAPENTSAHSYRLYAIHCDPAFDARSILREHQFWSAKHAPLEPLRFHSHNNEVSPERRLKIGFVSPDFCQHVVGVHLLPLLRARDHHQIEVFCYSGVHRKDRYTDQFQECADQWREILGRPDRDVAEMIRADEIDILVDLTLHASGNRLAVFGYKPAPIQVTYLAYCSTSGLDAMDYRFSDPFIDPPGFDESVYSEKTMRLPRSYWCYQPLGETPGVSPAPFQKNGFVTFGSFNAFMKCSEPALDLWLEILQEAPDSRLLMLAPGGSCREKIRERAAKRGIAQERMEFVSRGSWKTYLENLQRIDVALDPFPYGGGVSSCDALWMGAPLVTLAGRTAVGRGGQSILSNLGLPEFVAKTPGEYVQIAVSLAADGDRLSSLRSTLRERVERSALRDVKGCIRDLEEGFREMWRRWCEQQMGRAHGNTPEV